MLIPIENGLKDLLGFVPYFQTVDNSLYTNVGIKAQSNYIFMYDQEPLYPEIVSQYRAVQFYNEEVKFHHIIENGSWVELLAGSNYICNTSAPIWCHSEYNSPEIQELESNLFIPCYYWYHAFIARDWFRHYQYNRLLQPSDKSDCSFRFLLYARDHTGTRNYRKQMIENLSVHKSKILYNWDNKNVVGPEYSAKIDSEDALTSSIHLVAETLFQTTKVYLTEKVFKPMVMSQPFIIWGAPGTLEYLKRYGFKTFDGIWSEDYDKEVDDIERMLMLTKLVDDLACVSQEEFRKIFQKCLPIIEHNRKWFFNQKFIDNCWMELDKNFQQSFEKRREILQTNPGGQFFYVLNKNQKLLELSRYKSIVQQILPALDNNHRQKILDKFPYLKNI